MHIHKSGKYSQKFPFNLQSLMFIKIILKTLSHILPHFKEEIHVEK